MTTPTGDEAFLHELEIDVRAELAQADTSLAGDQAGTPMDEWMFDPADAQREDVQLRSLLGAVEAVEDGDRP